MSGRGLKGSKSLLSLTDVFDLTEASAYRVTPTYVYAFKKSSKGKGIVPVHIKHANVPKHWDDLVDPEAGSPLSNTVIGVIPRYYKAATDLQLKDKSQKLSDVMSPDGGSDSPFVVNVRQAYNVPQMVADADEALLPHHAENGKILAQKLKLKKPAQAVMLGWLLQTGSDYQAALNYIPGDDPSDEEVEEALDLAVGLVEKLQKAGLATTQENDEGEDIVQFSADALSPITQPVAKPAPKAKPPPAPVAAPPPSPTQPAASTPSAEAPALIQQGKDFLSYVPADVQEKFTQALGKKPGDATLVALSALNTYDDSHYAHNLKAQVKAAIQKAYPGASEDSVEKGASGVIAALKASQIIVDSPGGDEFLGYGPNGGLFQPKPKKKPTAASATPAPTPAAPPAPKAPTAPGLGAMFVPPLDTLMYAGDAKGTLGGYHAKAFLKDGVGTKYLFKPGEQAQAQAGQGYSALAAKVLDHTVPVVAGNVPGQGFGSVQPVIPNVQTDLSKVSLTTLTPAQLDTLVKERVLDWALASHDTKAANFLLTTDGKLVGIDKEQALKFVGKDELSLDYKPNPTKQVYSDLFDLYRKKKLDLTGSLPAMQSAIEKVEAISDAEWKATLQPYLDALPHGQKTSKAKAILDRKNSLRKDLEGFLTGLMRERGDIGPNDTFEFEKAEVAPKKKKKKDFGLGGGIPPMGSILSPPQVPPLSSLKVDTSKKLAGATGMSFTATDGYGKKYVVKMAVARDGSGTPQPYRVAAQEMFSQVSSVVRPGKSIPVGSIPEGFNGAPATVQPWVDGATPLGKGTSPSSLKDSEKKDIAEEHALDWLLSQHDTHGDNLLRRPDGSIVSIDKEQGFKYFLGFPGIPKDDKLSTDYHPNAKYGEDEAYYNKFWRAFSGGSMDFDPTVMKDAIARIEGIKDEEYVALLSKYAQAAPFSNDPKKVTEFLNKALERKKNIRADFEGFISGLYEKRTKKKGKFSFAGGWLPTGGAVAAPEPEAKPKKGAKKAETPSPENALQPVVELASGLKVQVASSPASTGSFGVLNPKMKTAEAVKLGVQEKPPVPEGYPEPAPGKMWKQTSLGAWLGSPTPGGMPVLYKEKAPKKDDGSGNKVKDESSPNVMVKLNVSAGDAQAVLDAIGIKAEPPVFEAGGYAIAIVNKDAWAKAKTADQKFSVQVDLPPQKLASNATSKFTATPLAGQLSEHVPATVGLDALNSMTESKDIGYGRAFATDGKGINLQSLCLQRCEDAGGTFYRFSFKIRPEQRNALVPAASGVLVPSFATKEATYNKDKDAWVQGTTPHSNFSYSARQWKSGSSTVTLGNDVDANPFASRNLAFADVRLNPGESLEDGLKRVLSAVSPALAEQATKTPSAEDMETVKLSAYLWSFAPQVADKLPESKRNPVDLKAEILKTVGTTEAKKKRVEADLANMELIETALGQITVALKGRADRMKGPGVKYVVRSVDQDLDFLEDQIKGATTSMLQRLTQGVSNYATSGDTDFKTGGGDYAFCNVRGTTKELPTWSGGNVRLMYDPSELDRLDIISYAPYKDKNGNSHTGDAFGCTNPEDGSFGHYFKNRKPVEETIGKDQEVIFRTGLNHRKLLKVMCKNKSFAEQLIQRLKKAGIEKVNGMLPEEFVVFAGHTDSASDFHTTFLKDAGY